MIDPWLWKLKTTFHLLPLSDPVHAIYNQGDGTEDDKQLPHETVFSRDICDTYVILMQSAYKKISWISYGDHFKDQLEFGVFD